MQTASLAHPDQKQRADRFGIAIYKDEEPVANIIPAWR
jgi:hypothetical protein